ncbi:MmyB family transcriptional regulator [Microbacterium helvum]|uniref:MmyB family transcriptional regulator n=1 Tax=Microbacterium helvum TaxID=2773713 RepID=UPI001CD12CF3|nr:hypothetical protein [Microbacterium helvum]
MSTSLVDLRATVARYPHDPRPRRLVGDLRSASPDLEKLWNTATGPAIVLGTQTLVE